MCICVYIYMDNGLFVDDLSIENDGFPMAMVRLAAFYRHSSPRPFGQVTFEAELRLTIATHHLVTLHLRASWTPNFGTPYLGPRSRTFHPAFERVLNITVKEKQRTKKQPQITSKELAMSDMFTSVGFHKDRGKPATTGPRRIACPACPSSAW